MGRKATADEVTLAADRFVDVFYYADVGLAILDDQLRYLAINSFLANIHGVSVDLHIGKRLQDMVGGLTTQLEPAYKRTLFSGNAVLELDVKGAVSAKTVSGHWIDSLFPLKDAKGRVKQVCAVVAEPWSRRRMQGPYVLPNARPVLRSWKEIAQYVGACTKTVQRWEASHEFPVRRLKVSKGAVVFAMKDEVDRWMRDRTPKPARSETDEPFRSLFLTSPIPTLIFNDEHVIVDANVAMAALLGSEADQLVGRMVESACKPIAQHGSNTQQRTSPVRLYKITRVDGTAFESEYILQNIAPGLHSLRFTNTYLPITSSLIHASP